MIRYFCASALLCRVLIYHLIEIFHDTRIGVIPVNDDFLGLCILRKFAFDFLEVNSLVIDLCPIYIRSGGSLIKFDYVS